MRRKDREEEGWTRRWRKRNGQGWWREQQRGGKTDKEVIRRRKHIERKGKQIRKGAGVHKKEKKWPERTVGVEG